MTLGGALLAVGSFVVVGAVAGCGEEVTSGGLGGVDGSAADSSGSKGHDASSPDRVVVDLDSGPTCSHPPDKHRPTPVACPTARGPGHAAPQPDGGPPPACTSDSDCTMSKNGRCLTIGLIGGGCAFDAGCVCGFDGCVSTGCSYDTCFADTDCSGGVACVCRDSASSNTANVCGTGGNCRIDSDCSGPCPYCSQSGDGYFCHTALDTCANDTDCPSSVGSCASFCVYDPNAAAWSCVNHCLP
jgi:hypothetical protein